MTKREMIYTVVGFLVIILCISASAFGIGPDKNKIVISLQPASTALEKGTDNTAKFKEVTNGSPGEPGLPVRTLTVLLPPDADLSSVKVDIIQGRYDEVEGKWDVQPAPPVATTDGQEPIWPQGKQIVNGRDVQVYNINEFRPNSIIGRINIGQWREWRLVDISINPYQYNPVSQKIRSLVSGDLVVTFNRIPGLKIQDCSRNSSQKIQAFLEKKAVNFKDVAPEYTEAQKTNTSK